jgi:hypothetical protein
VPSTPARYPDAEGAAPVQCFEVTTDSSRKATPQIEAMNSLLDDVDQKLPWLVGFDHTLRFDQEAEKQRADLRETADRWAAIHPELADRLRSTSSDSDESSHAPEGNE